MVFEVCRNLLCLVCLRVDSFLFAPQCISVRENMCSVKAAYLVVHSNSKTVINCNIYNVTGLRQCYRKAGRTVDRPWNCKPHNHVSPRRVWELPSALVEEWSNILQQELADLLRSVKMRCTIILKAARGHIRYVLLLLILTPTLFIKRLWNLFSSVCLSCWTWVSTNMLRNLLELKVECVRMFLFIHFFLHFLFQYFWEQNICIYFCVC